MKNFFLLFFPVFCFGQPTLDTVSLLNGKVKILCPKELTSMSDEMWAIKYQKRARPTVALTDKDGEVNLIANTTEFDADDSALAEFVDFQVGQLKSKRSDFNLLSKGVKNANGRTVGYFKFLSQAIDQKVFNYYFFIVVDGKILLFTFNCIQKLQSKWEQTADAMLLSLTIK